jgi:hypothetical protein
MADTITIRDSSGVNVPVSVDDLTSLNGVSVTDVHIQRFKLVFGGDATGVDVDATHPLPVTIGNFPASQPVSAALGSPVAVRLSDGTSALATTAGRLQIDDGGQSLTVDGTVSTTDAGDVATTLTDGRKTVTTPGTAVAVRASLACKWVCVTALKTNTDQVNVGGSAVLATLGSSTGSPLAAGESVTVPVDNANKVFVDARVSGEGVSFTVGS